MTHLLLREFPKDEQFIICRNPINVNDRIIFQNEPDPEVEVIVVNVKDQPGLMKGWKVVSWRNEL